MDRRGVTRVVAVAANTFRETVRERVLYNLVFFAVLMTVSGLVLRQLAVHQDEKIIKDLGLASMDIFGHLIAIFLGVGLVGKEIERRSLYPLLAKPLSRGEFLLGKFAGLAFTLWVNLVVMAGGLYLTLLATGGKADLALLKACYLIFLGLLLVVSIALLFSAVTSSTVTAAICTVSLVLAGRFSDVIRNVKEVAPDAPAWLLDALYYALPNFRNFDVKNQVVYGDPVSWSLLLAVTGYWLVYTALALAVAHAAFLRRELQ